MGKRIYPLKRIKYWWAYDIDEICELYKEYSLHPQTIRKWTKNGLSVMKGKPLLIYGHTLHKFLGDMNKSNQCQTEFDQMFCMKCKDAQLPFKRQVQLDYTKGFIKAKSICKSCKTIMYKSYKLDHFQKLKRIFNMVDVLELYDSKHPTCKTHLDAQEEALLSEPVQRELF